MRRSAPLLHLVAAVLLWAGPRTAYASSSSSENGAVESVPVTVTAVAGGSFYLDQGRQAHIEPGDPVRVKLVNGKTVETTVSAVSWTSARAEVPSGEFEVHVGDLGEVFVLADRLLEDEESGLAVAGPEVPEHPPWTQPPKEWDTSTPLLAPAFGLPPELQIHGRLYANFSATWDAEHDNRYSLGRIGSEIFVENPLQMGGQLHIEGELFRRETHLDQGDGETTNLKQLDRLSYRRGGTREEPVRFEVGRFLQNGLPEFGVIDGIEYSQRNDRGDTVGASLGAMPEWNPSMKTQEDLQAVVFFRRQSSFAEGLDWAVGYQNTWHRGDQDRNLLLGTIDFRPVEGVHLHGTAWIDYYGPGDEIKSDGFELTEARLNGDWRIDDDNGLGCHVARVRWPELLRDEFQNLLPSQIRRNKVTRLGVNGWHRFSPDVRLNTRLSGWSDQDDDGYSGDARLSLRHVMIPEADLSLGLFKTRGAFTDQEGFRVSAGRTFEAGRYGSVLWEVERFDQGSIHGGTTNLYRQTLRAAISTMIGNGWSLSLFAERRFGDEQDSYDLGAYVQTRF